MNPNQIETKLIARPSRSRLNQRPNSLSPPLPPSFSSSSSTTYTDHQRTSIASSNDSNFASTMSSVSQPHLQLAVRPDTLSSAGSGIDSGSISTMEMASSNGGNFSSNDRFFSAEDFLQKDRQKPAKASLIQKRGGSKGEW